MLRRAAAGAVLVAAMTLVSALGPALAGAAPTKAPEWLYVQDAPNATLKPLGHQRFLLTLVKPDQTVDAFTNRPLRRLGSRPLDQFVDSWGSSGFKKVPPNAAITAARGGADGDVLIVKLGVPRLNKHSGNVSYVVTPLGKPGRQRSDLARLVKRADTKLPRRLGKTTLFIDDADDTDAEPVRIDINSTVSFQADFSGPAFQFTGLTGTTAGGPPQSNFYFASFGSSSEDAPPSLTVHNEGANSMTAYAFVNSRDGCIDLYYSPVIGTASVGAADTISNPPDKPLTAGWNAIPVVPQNHC